MAEGSVTEEGKRRRILAHTTHGRTHSPEHRAWAAMKQRCNPKYHQHQNYIDRGITVCERWRNSFEAFFEDVGLRPSPKHELDRIDNDGNYDQ